MSPLSLAYSQTAGKRILFSLSKFTAKASAFLVAAPLMLLFFVFLPLAFTYGAWMRYRYFNEENETLGGNQNENHENVNNDNVNNQSSGRGSNTTYGDVNDEELNEEEESILMENTFSRREKLKEYKNLRHRRHPSDLSSSSSIVDDYSSVMNPDISIADEYKALKKKSIYSNNTSEQSRESLSSSSYDNTSSSIENISSSSSDNTLASIEHKKLLERARQRLTKERENVKKVNDSNNLRNNHINNNNSGNGMLLSGLSMVNMNSDSDSDSGSDDYIPDNFQGGGYFELYGDMSQVNSVLLSLIYC